MDLTLCGYLEICSTVLPGKEFSFWSPPGSSTTSAKFQPNFKVTATQADIEAQQVIPDTTRFIMLGHSVMTASRWMLSIEGKVLLTLDNSDNFILAFAVLFASYYIFNTKYQESAACTLELVQRFLVRINPEDSNASQRVKCTARQGVSKKTKRVVQRKVTTINPHVNSFIRSLMEFEWKTSN